MNVEIAADIVQLNEFGKCTGIGPFELAPRSGEAPEESRAGPGSHRRLLP